MANIKLVRDVPFGRIEFEQREDDNGRQTYRAYHVIDADDKRTRCVSVTTFLDVLAKRALYRWNEEQGIRAALSLERGGMLKDVGIDDATGVIRDNGWGAEAALNTAAKRGIGIHDPLERFLRDGTIPNPADYPPDHRGYIRALLGWLAQLEARGFEVEDVEYLVADPKLRLAGRPDARLTIAGQSIMVDLKTNRHGRVWTEHMFQPIAYGLCDEACGRDPIDGGLIVALGPDGRFEEMPALASGADVKAVLDVDRRMKKLNSAIDNARERQRLARLKAAA